MRYLFLLLFLGSSLCGMEELRRPISQAEFETAKPWRKVLFHGTHGERFEKVKQLLKAGVDPGMRVPRMKFSGCGATTPLHWAAEADFKDIVCYLLAYGADPKTKDGNGEDAFFKAFADYRRQDLFRKLGTHVPTPDMSIVKCFLLQGVDPHKNNNFNISVLDFIHEDDAELREMLEDFETYKSNHAKEFDDIRYEHDLLRIKIEFENKLKRFGLRNTLSGICEPRPSSTRPNGLSGAGKRKRDDDEGFHSPRSHATFVEE